MCPGLSKKALGAITEGTKVPELGTSSLDNVKTNIDCSLS